MKIVVFNTSSTETVVTGIGIPGDADELDKIALKHPEYDITVVSAEFFYSNRTEGGCVHPKYVKVVDMPYTASLDDYVAAIEKEHPDVLISVPTVSKLADWNSITEAMICDKFKGMGVRTICHSLKGSVACFDKEKTHEFLDKLGIKNAGYLKVDYSLYRLQDHSDGVITLNVYREYIKAQAERLSFPVIIKDNVGSSSIGVQKAENVQEVMKILDSELFTNDLIIEEFITGEQFGTEIHGCKGNYSIIPPFMLTVNGQGVTDGVKGIKFGPVFNKRFEGENLLKDLRLLAEKMDLGGVANVDLVFHNGQWYVIEINPRWSGMTGLLAACEGRGIFDIYFDCLHQDIKDYSIRENLLYGCEFKMFGIGADALGTIEKLPYVSGLEWGEYAIGGHKTGVCVVAIAGFKNMDEFLAAFDDLDNKYPGAIFKETKETCRYAAAQER